MQVGARGRGEICAKTLLAAEKRPDLETLEDCVTVDDQARGRTQWGLDVHFLEKRHELLMSVTGQGVADNAAVKSDQKLGHMVVPCRSCRWRSQNGPLWRPGRGHESG